MYSTWIKVGLVIVVLFVGGTWLSGLLRKQQAIGRAEVRVELADSFRVQEESLLKTIALLAEETRAANERHAQDVARLDSVRTVHTVSMNTARAELAQLQNVSDSLVTALGFVVGSEALPAVRAALDAKDSEIEALTAMVDNLEARLDDEVASSLAKDLLIAGLNNRIDVAERGWEASRNQNAQLRLAIEDLQDAAGGLSLPISETIVGVVSFVLGVLSAS